MPPYSSLVVGTGLFSSSTTASSSLVAGATESVSWDGWISPPSLRGGENDLHPLAFCWASLSAGHVCPGEVLAPTVPAFGRHVCAREALLDPALVDWASAVSHRVLLLAEGALRGCGSATGTYVAPRTARLQKAPGLSSW